LRTLAHDYWTLSQQEQQQQPYSIVEGLFNCQRAQQLLAHHVQKGLSISLLKITMSKQKQNVRALK
jgi:hypothetical protein